MPLISCTNLRFGYAGGPVLTCPDFTVGSGDYVRITGSNGTGKTTLLRVLAGLLAPQSGEVVRHATLLPGTVGYLPQRPPLQDDFPATVWEVVLSGCQSLRGWRPYFRPGEVGLARAALRRFGIADLAKRSYAALSGGQRQRVLLARSMAVPRKLMLFDEPTTGLDCASVAALEEGLRTILAEGVALVVVTHEKSFLGDATRSFEVCREGVAHG